MVTSPKMIIIRFTRYCRIDDPFFLRQKVEMMKNTESQIISLLRMNIPAEQRIRDRKLVPSGYYCTTSLAGS